MRRGKRDDRRDAPRLTLTLQQSEDVVLSHWALDVTDDGTGGVVHELDSDLGHTSSRACPAEDLQSPLISAKPLPEMQVYLDDFGELNGGF